MTSNDDDVVARIVKAHWAEELRAYSGNIKIAIEIVANDWVTSVDVNQHEAHLKVLRSHLADSEIANVDEFLFHIGLAIPGIYRGIRPPLLVLSDNRGGLSPKHIREIAGQLERWQNALTIGRQILPTLSDVIGSAFAELLAIANAQPDCDVVLEIANLPLQDADRLATAAIHLLDAGDAHSADVALTILQRLACQRAEPLKPAVSLALISHDQVYPPSMFRDGGDLVASKLLTVLETQLDATRLNHQLLALAWTRSLVACNAFASWKTTSPKWAETLCAPLQYYLHDAGLCLDDKLERRDLIFQPCFRLRLDSAGSATVPCRIATDRHCPSCSGPLSFLFDFSKIDRGFFPGGFSALPHRILCCLHCACYMTTFVGYRVNTEGDWHKDNGICKFPFESVIEPSYRKLDESPCPPFAAAQAFDQDDVSSLGGVPMWQLDTQYPDCVGCRRPMPFLAQHDNGLLREEGIFYAFYCDACQISAVNYQQT